MSEYKVIGLMSGTSLDGLDLAYCSFRFENGSWKFAIIHAETIPYSQEWLATLSSLPGSSALEYASADHAYGHLLGKLCKDFMVKYDIHPDFIASHGHTVFHQPDRGFTAQIGNGAAIKAETTIPVLCDFRSGDVANGGQGAPLVPAGDRLLFPMYDYCINLGGFANISYDLDGNRLAYDICPVNIVLNTLAMKAGYPFDRDGQMAASGKPDDHLLSVLDQLEFYGQTGPKSLGKEWVDDKILPLIQNKGLRNEDILNTYCAHVAHQIALHTGTDPERRVLLTGGGTFNKYLVSLIKSALSPQLVLPDILTINYKEALIFAFLGVLRLRNEVNCFRTVTGASRDGSYGAGY